MLILNNVTMPEIVIQNLSNKKVPADDTVRPLLYHFQQSYLDWMHACGGKGRCTTCKVVVLEGLDNFEPLTEAEQRYERQGALRANERLACQARIKGDILIRVPEEGKLPHIRYSE